MLNSLPPTPNPKVTLVIGTMILLIRLAEIRTGGYSYLFPIGSVGTYKFKDVIIRGDLRRISKKIIEEKRGI